MPRILLFAKAPVPGFAKTRLIPLLGAEGAAEFARRMFETACREALASGLEVEIVVTPPPSDPAWSGLLPAGIKATDQGGGDLGERLARATERAIAGGDSAILIGTDCPSLGRDRLAVAAASLSRCDAFIHPAQDGGYALLALRRHSERLFSGIPWSGPKVYAATLDRLNALGWSHESGEVLRDIDEPADLKGYLDEAGIERLKSARMS